MTIKERRCEIPRFPELKRVKIHQGVRLIYRLTVRMRKSEKVVFHSSTQKPRLNRFLPHNTEYGRYYVYLCDSSFLPRDAYA